MAGHGTVAAWHAAPTVYGPIGPDRLIAGPGPPTVTDPIGRGGPGCDRTRVPGLAGHAPGR
eukprot:577235-Hanusia_phi.AAC.1